jgi:uncharacterized protein YecA (UPF0149 family)
MNKDYDDLIKPREERCQPGVVVICPPGSQLKSSKRIGPNDKCHCGSGKKYKKCCMDKF